jgi:hypothetical protein
MRMDYEKVPLSHSGIAACRTRVRSGRIAADLPDDETVDRGGRTAKDSQSLTKAAMRKKLTHTCIGARGWVVS